MVSDMINHVSDNKKVYDLYDLIKQMKVKNIQIQDQQAENIVKKKLHKNAFSDSYISLHINEYLNYGIFPDFKVIEQNEQQIIIESIGYKYTLSK